MNANELSEETYDAQGGLSSVRIDKWLFAARIYKSRSLASEAVQSGRVKIGGEALKPHRPLRLGEEIVIKRDGRTLTYKVLRLIDKRVGAKDVKGLYEMTEDADIPPEMRVMLKLFREAQSGVSNRRGRPTKKDRREIDRFRNDY